MAATDDHTRLLRGLLAAVNDLDALPHESPVGRVMPAAAVAGRSCSDDAVALADIQHTTRIGISDHQIS